jgi:hypothetical protein
MGSLYTYSIRVSDFGHFAPKKTPCIPPFIVAERVSVGERLRKAGASGDSAAVCGTK